MAPFLFVLTIKESYYPAFWKLIRGWAHVLVYGMGFRIDKQIDEALDREKSYMFCPNHASLMDPFVLIVLSKNPIVFVGKKELAQIRFLIKKNPGLTQAQITYRLEIPQSTTKYHLNELIKENKIFSEKLFKIHYFPVGIKNNDKIIFILQ